MATMTAPLPPTTRIPGGAFLIADASPDDCFFPEDFTDEHRQIAQTTLDFADQRGRPRKRCHRGEGLCRHPPPAAQGQRPGLTSVDIPEQYGGLEMDKISSAIVAENIAQQGSFCVIFSAHVGIGTLPIVWYGTPQQKQQLPAQARQRRVIGAYALSESTSGSDALNARTHAVLSPDGDELHAERREDVDHQRRHGRHLHRLRQMNPDGRKAYRLPHRTGTPGFTVGHEEHKLGIRGSSTCPLILADCKMPAANLLGEVGKGHHIAFNILNIGRYKLGATVLGAAKLALNQTIRYAIERKAFGKSICEFGLVQEKIADCAAGIFAGEALCYRTSA